MKKVRISDPLEVGGKLYLPGLYDLDDKIADQASKKGAQILGKSETPKAPKPKKDEETGEVEKPKKKTKKTAAKKTAKKAK